jgi:hypothetical protein
MDHATLSKTVKRLPSALMGLSISDNLKPALIYLQSRLQLDDASLGKIIGGSPSPLALSLSDNIEPKLDWLQQRLHLNDAQVSKIVR